MRHQIWRLAALNDNSETKVGEPLPKGEAFAEANRLNDKPVDGTLHVARPVDMVQELDLAIARLIDLLNDEHAVEDIDGMPLSVMADTALQAIETLNSRLECDRGFNSSGLVSLADDRDKGWGGQ